MAACSARADPQALDRIVDLMNKDPKTGGNVANANAPRDVMQVPLDDSILWAGNDGRRVRPGRRHGRTGGPAP